MPQRLITEASIRTGLALSPSSIRDLLLSMGVSTSPKNYAKVRKIALETGISFPFPLMKTDKPRRVLFDEKLLEKLSKECWSRAEMLNQLGYSHGRIPLPLERQMSELGLSFPTGRGNKKKSLAHNLLKSKRVSGQTLRKILVTELDRTDECCYCGQGPHWNGKPLVLQVDHRDGVKSNNSPENLDIVCPNCHTQTPTFSGRNLKRE